MTELSQGPSRVRFGKRRCAEPKPAAVFTFMESCDDGTACARSRPMYVLGVFNVVAAVMLIGAPQPLLPERAHPCTLPEL